jgi:hypothetical protein
LSAINFTTALQFPATLRLPPNDSTHAATQVSLNEIERSPK